MIRPPTNRHRHHVTPAKHESLEDACLVLDVRRLGLTTDRSRVVSILESVVEDERLRLFVAVIGNQVGLRAFASDNANTSFQEQSIDLTASRAFGRAERLWLACGGADGNGCANKGLKLYLPPGESRFACADCHGLSQPRGHGLSRRGREMRPWLLTWQEPSRTTLTA